MLQSLILTVCLFICLQAKHTVYTLRFSTGFGRGSGLELPFVGIQVRKACHHAAPCAMLPPSKTYAAGQRKDSGSHSLDLSSCMLLHRYAWWAGMGLRCCIACRL